MTIEETLREFRRAKEERGESLAVVMSGGGSKCRWEYGALIALKELGILPLVDIIVGASGGGLNAAIAGISLTRRGDLSLGREIWDGITEDRHVFAPEPPSGPAGFGRAALLLGRDALGWTVPSLLDPAGLRALLIKHCGEMTFSDLYRSTGKVFGCPAWCYNTLATDLLTGDVRLYDGALATSAIEGLFPAVKVDGKFYGDGGLLDNQPADQAMALGATRVLVLFCSPDREKLQQQMDYKPGMIRNALRAAEGLMASTEDATWARFDAQLRAKQEHEALGPVPLMLWPEEDTGGMLDFTTTHLMERGRVDALMNLTDERVEGFLLG